MKIVKNYKETPEKKMDTETVKGVTGRVAVGKADGATNFCMRVFEIEKDGYTPRHAHDWEHEIFIHEGKGQVFKAGEWIDVEKGSFLFIPGNEEHQFRNSGDAKFVFICLIPEGPPEL